MDHSRNPFLVFLAHMPTSGDLVNLEGQVETRSLRTLGRERPDQEVTQQFCRLLLKFDPQVNRKNKGNEKILPRQHPEIG